jgi:hypothetical protein
MKTFLLLVCGFVGWGFVVNFLEKNEEKLPFYIYILIIVGFVGLGQWLINQFSN